MEFRAVRTAWRFVGTHIVLPLSIGVATLLAISYVWPGLGWDLTLPYAALLVVLTSGPKTHILIGKLAVVTTVGILAGCSGSLGIAKSLPQHTEVPGGAVIEAYFFWSGACTQCLHDESEEQAGNEAQRSEKMRSLLDNLVAQYPQVQIVDFEVAYNPENRDRLESTAASAGAQHSSVPMVFIGSRYWIDYDEETRREIQAYVESLLEGNDAHAIGAPADIDRDQGFRYQALRRRPTLT